MSDDRITPEEMGEAIHRAQMAVLRAGLRLYEETGRKGDAPTSETRYPLRRPVCPRCEREGVTLYVNPDDDLVLCKRCRNELKRRVGRA